MTFTPPPQDHLTFNSTPSYHPDGLYGTIMAGGTDDDTGRTFMQELNGGVVSAVHGYVVGRNVNGTKAAVWTYVALVDTAGLARMVTSNVTKVGGDSSTSTWDVSLVLGNPSGVAVLVTGAASETVNWIVSFDVLETS